MRVRKMAAHPTMEKILDLTLEIITLVTGEKCAVVRMASIEGLLQGLYPSKSVNLSGSPALTPPPHSPTPEKPNEKKILEVTNKITELLSGEGGDLAGVSIQEVIKLEDEEEDDVVEEDDDVVELGYSEGPGDLYKNAMLDYRPSPGGSSTRKPSEISPHPLYSRNSTQKCLQIPRRDEVYALERSPLYFRDAPMEEHNILRHYQGEHLAGIKVEDKEAEEERYARDDQRSAEKAGIMVMIKEEERSTDFETAHEHNTLVGRLSLHPDCNIEDDDITPYSPIQSDITPGVHRFPDTSNFEESSVSGSKPVTLSSGNETFPCPECHKCFTSKSAMYGHQKVHAVDRSFICSECGKTFKNNVCLRIHQYSHSGKFPFSCPECGKGFPHQSNLVAHIRSHTGERPYSCPECGKCFTKRSRLVIHQRYHTGEKPYSCSDCGKGFADAYVFKKHQKLHAIVRPYRCLECGKGFILKNDLETHQRRHTGELQYLCSECGKCFVTKSELIRHQAVHTGLKPYSCSQCSKCFFNKSHLVRHEKGHVKEKPYLCFICGRGFLDGLQLAKHQRCHTAERLFSCPECEKSFVNKSSLVRHQLTHAGENLDSRPIFAHALEPTQSGSPSGAFSVGNGS